MWPKVYRDYPVDSSLKKEQVAPSRGIIGCEMHDLNGWGQSYHIPVKVKKGLIAYFLDSLSRYFKS